MRVDRNGRKIMDIETVLQWAYRQELPKASEMSGAGGSMAPGFSIADLGVSVDNWQHEPGFPAIMGSPHPDALTISKHVQALPPLEVDAVASRRELLPEAWRLIDPDDWLRTRVHVDRAVYVISHAKMGTRPEWRAGWTLHRIIGRNGKPMVDGLDANGAYQRGARCPLEVLPSPREIVTDRAIYAAWHLALGELAQALADRLETIAPEPPECSPKPWMDGPEPPIVIHPDLTKPALSRGRARSTLRRRTA